MILTRDMQTQNPALYPFNLKLPSLSIDTSAQFIIYTLVQQNRIHEVKERTFQIFSIV